MNGTKEEGFELVRAIVEFSKATEKHSQGRSIQLMLIGALVDLTDHLNGKQADFGMDPAPEYQADYVLAVMKVIMTVAGPDVGPTTKVFDTLGVKGR